MVPRHLQPLLTTLLREFPVVTVVGSRQIGKTTLVRGFSDRHYVTLDDVTALGAAKADPAGFIGGLALPVTLDEVQRAPELLLPIKHLVDRRRRPGQFLLTGSARIDHRAEAGESLAGRSATLRLRPLTWAERRRRPDYNAIDALLEAPSGAALVRRFPLGTAFAGTDVLAGGMPLPLLKLKGKSRERWFQQYRSSYLERDVPPLLRVDEVAAFVRFVSLVATRTAQTTHYSALAHDVGVSVDTALRWAGVLEASFLVDRLPPYFRNVGKRLVKSPKLHFGDAGLAAHFMGMGSWRDALRLGHSGSLVETLVAQQLLAFAGAASRSTHVFHYRTHAGAEVDLVIERGARLLPIEVKTSATIRPNDVRGLSSFLDDFPREAPLGVVLYAGTQAIPVARRIVALPLTAVLEATATIKS